MAKDIKRRADVESYPWMSLHFIIMTFLIMIQALSLFKLKGCIDAIYKTVQKKSMSPAFLNNTLQHRL